jgi:ferric-dicitrate binding protein FerR (iron transport regulator)
VNVEVAWKQFRKQQMKQPVFKGRRYNFSKKTNWKAILFRAAAVILVVALVGFFSWHFMNNNRPKSVPSVEAMNKVTTKKGEKKQITFTDGTMVILNASSSLRFHKEFSLSKREVYLNGEAYFNVTHDKTRPFIVNTAHAVVKVLGTKFDVKAWKKDRKAVIGVRQGKVAVISPDSLHSSQKKSSHIFLTNGQAATVKDGQISSVRRINVADMVLWRSGGLYFNNTPFSDVVKQIGRRFDVNIKIQKSSLKNVPFTGTFKHAGLNEVLNVVAASMGTHYIREDSEIVFE